MAYNPNIRVSDADRDRAAELLREHHAAGRLTAEEFSERLDQTFTAKTVGEIDALLRDLPAIDTYRLPDAALTRRAPPPKTRRSRDAWRVAFGSWFTVALVCFVVWALSGRGYLWPLWVIGPWGAILLGRWVTGLHPQGGRNELRGPGGSEPGRLPSGDEDLPGRPG